MCEAAVKKLCPNCHTEMELTVKSYPMGSALMKNRLHADLYCCPACKKIELYATEEKEMTVCPVCGATHPANEKCVSCAVNSAFDGTYTELK